MDVTAALIGLERETEDRIGPVLTQLELAVERFTTAADAVERMTTHRFRVAICRYPLPDLTTAELLRTIRSRAAVNRDTPLLVLTMPELREEARVQVGRGPFLVAATRDPLTVLHAFLAHLVRLEARRAVDLPARLIVGSGGEQRCLEARVVNLSLSGMLLARLPLLPVATPCRFELPLDGRQVCGTAEVVRHTRPARERVQGFAVRFLTLEPLDRDRLAARLAEA